MERQYIAEAKFIRAYVNFQLLCMYGDQALLGNDQGEGIILRSDAYNGYNPDEIASRSTNADCWNFILKDLETDALPDLPDDVPSVTERIRANQTVAKALLSRIYLYKGTYTNNQADLKKACDYAKEVIAKNGYSFSSSSSEYSTALFPTNESPQGNWQRLIHYKTGSVQSDTWIWNKTPETRNIKAKEAFIKSKRKWSLLKERYLKYKNDNLRFNNNGLYSFTCYEKAVNDVYNQLQLSSLVNHGRV